jgi:hypothetical protein
MTVRGISGRFDHDGGSLLHKWGDSSVPGGVFQVGGLFDKQVSFVGHPPSVAIKSSGGDRRQLIFGPSRRPCEMNDRNAGGDKTGPQAEGGFKQNVFSVIAYQ